MEELERSIGEALIALGLYSACFETMVLVFRAKVHEILRASEPAAIPSFRKACRTAHETFQFCGPILVRMGVLSNDDFVALDGLRRRRNELAHQGYNHVFTLQLADVEEDLRQIHAATAKVERSGSLAPAETVVGESRPFQVSPLIITNFARQIASHVIAERLPRVRQ